MTATERSQISFGLTAIPYMVKRSPRRGTVSIAIDPTDGVLVTAPQATPIARLDRVVHAKARWIVEHMKPSACPERKAADREFITGETFLYLGRQYRLRVVRGRDTHVALTGGRLVVETPNLTPAAVKLALAAWYRQHAAERIPERVRVWAKKMDIAAPAVLIRDQRRRWGSCDSKGKLRFNWRIIQAPTRLIDYVVAHELVHLEHRDHTAKFWGTLERLMADYEDKRDLLRSIGPLLAWAHPQEGRQ